jgi:hypothetical protein
MNFEAGPAKSVSDNGRFVPEKDGFSDGSIQLLQHLIGNLNSLGAFKAVHYDYWECSKPMKLYF